MGTSVSTLARNCMYLLEHPWVPCFKPVTTSNHWGGQMTRKSPEGRVAVDFFCLWWNIFSEKTRNLPRCWAPYPTILHTEQVTQYFKWNHSGGSKATCENSFSTLTNWLRGWNLIHIGVLWHITTCCCAHERHGFPCLKQAFWPMCFARQLCMAATHCSRMFLSFGSPFIFCLLFVYC
jgi:hypothetical protein